MGAIIRFQMGRSHIKTVAEARKQEMEKFLHELWRKAPEVCEVCRSTHFLDISFKRKEKDRKKD